MKKKGGKGCGFVPPDANQRIAAVALPRLQSAKDERSRRLWAYLKEAIQDEVAFPPIPVPLPGQWLADNHEAGQPVKKYVKSGYKKPQSADAKPVPKGNRAINGRNTIYLIPMGHFEEDRSPPLEELKRFGEAYLCMKMAILPGLHLRPSDEHPATHFQVDFPPSLQPKNPAAREHEIKWRPHYQHKERKQLSSRDIHSLLRFVLPTDGFCVIALLMEDLFPTDNEKSYVAGEADISSRAGVFSFARFHPDFFSDETVLRALAPGEKAVMLRRSCKLMVHELVHLFGLAHCIHYHCIMNGTKGLVEGAAKPAHLCPCCLHKVFIFREHTEGFDVQERYQALYDFFREHADGFGAELAWTAAELERLGTCLEPRRRPQRRKPTVVRAAEDEGEEEPEEED